MLPVNTTYPTQTQWMQTYPSQAYQHALPSLAKPWDVPYMRYAIQLSHMALHKRLFPIAAVLVDAQGQLLAAGTNEERLTGTPIEHGEMVAIRNACRQVGRERLQGSTLYTTCEPCPMCLGASYWAKVGRIVYANSNQSTAKLGFDDLKFYNDLALPQAQRSLPMIQMLENEALPTVAAWFQKENVAKQGVDYRTIQAQQSAYLPGRQLNVLR